MLNSEHERMKCLGSRTHWGQVVGNPSSEISVTSWQPDPSHPARYATTRQDRESPVFWTL